MSNTKLTREEKQELKHQVRYLEQQGQDFAFAQAMGFTVLAVRTGPRTAKISTSVASVREQKVRAKVGRYHAVMRYLEGACVPVPCDTYNTMEDIASTFVYAVI